MTAEPGAPRAGDAARKALAFFAALAGLAIIGGVFAQRILGYAAGPDAEIVSELKNTESGQLKLGVPGASEPLVGETHFYARIVVDWKKGADDAIATSTLDLDGALGPTKVSSVGLEKIPFVHKDGDWVAPDGFAPRLVAIVSALERRRRALEAGDTGSLRALAGWTPEQLAADPEVQRVLALRGRSYRAESWLIRSDREEVIVTEESRLIGDTPDRPIDEKRTRRLLLRERGREFLFAAGLM